MSGLGIMVPLFGIACGMVAIVGGAIVRPWLAYRERRLEVEAAAASQDAAAARARTEQLERRVATLERIVTDRGVALADEIEALRSPERRIGAEARR